jgi:hypothetical protein
MARKPPDSKCLNALEIKDQQMQQKSITGKENRPSVNVKHTENNISQSILDMNTKWLWILWDEVTISLLTISLFEAYIQLPVVC